MISLHHFSTKSSNTIPSFLICSGSQSQLSPLNYHYDDSSRPDYLVNLQGKSQFGKLDIQLVFLNQVVTVHIQKDEGFQHIHEHLQSMNL